MTALPARLATPVAEYDRNSARWGICAVRSQNDEAEHYATRQGEQRPFTGTHPDEVRQGWPGQCEACSAPIPWDDPDMDVYGSSGTVRVYDTASGRLEPGCLFWVDQHPGRSCFAGWTNCDGQHLHAVLPTGQYWDIDSRASNCGSPADTEHRCWIRHGEPPAVHVDKNGRTCTAGAGSIAVVGWHGFLHHGRFVP